MPRLLAGCGSHEEMVYKATFGGEMETTEIKHLTFSFVSSLTLHPSFNRSLSQPITMSLPFKELSPDAPPFVQVKGLYNLRDVGGYPIPSTSLQTRPKTLYRGGTLKVIPAATMTELAALGVRTVFDFRSRPEIEKVARGGDPLEMVNGREAVEDPNSVGNAEPDELVMLREGSVEREGVRRVWAPVFAKRDFSPAAVESRLRRYANGGIDGFLSAYEEAMRDGTDAFGAVARHLAATGGKEGEGATMVHCTGGKDRTGICCGLLLSLVGLEKEVVGAEYELTQVGFEPYKAFWEEKDRDLWKHPLFQGPDGQEAVRRMVGSP
jgi:hypothetical protein